MPLSKPLLQNIMSNNNEKQLKKLIKTLLSDNKNRERLHKTQKVMTRYLNLVLLLWRLAHRFLLRTRRKISRKTKASNWVCITATFLPSRIQIFIKI